MICPLRLFFSSGVRVDAVITSGMYSNLYEQFQCHLVFTTADTKVMTPIGFWRSIT
jgi:hypothetical protein